MPFTVVFNDEGTIDKVFKVGLTGPASQEVTPHTHTTEGMRGVIAPTVSKRLIGKAVKNVTSVSILTTEDHDPCISQGNYDYCW